MIVQRYISNRDKIGLDSDGFLIGDISYIKSDSGDKHFDYSLKDYNQIIDIMENPYSIIIGSGGLGKSTLLKQIEEYLNERNQSYKRIDLRILVNENTLNELLLIFLRDKERDQIIYILLDAVDEAIDHNIRNPIELITQSVKKVKENYPNTRFIITSRSNVNTINELSTSLAHIYSIDKRSNTYIYNLCPLTKDDARDLAVNFEISDVDKFITDIKNYHLTPFLTSPITFKSVADLYKIGKISNLTTHYDIYYELITELCRESSEYRIKQAHDNIDKYKIYHPEKLMFIASKLAIDIKIQNKSSVSENRNDTSVSMNDYFDISIKDFNNKNYIFSSEEVKATLNSNLFYKVGSEYYFCQKTYFDFLCAYYLINIGIDIKHFNKFFVFENKIHPNYHEILSLLCLKSEQFFAYYKNKCPEALIFSQVLFNRQNYNKFLLNKYMNMVNTISYYPNNINKFDIYKKLYYNNPERDIRKFFKSKNEDVLYATIDYIYINKIDGFDKELENIIFNNKYSNRLKMNAILIIRDIESYSNLASEVYKHIDKIETFLERNDYNDLRAVFLEVMYPKFFSEDKLLSYIVPDNRSSYFGWYHYYITQEFLNEKYINSDNYLKLFKWVINNRLRGVTESIHGNHEFPENIKRFFVVIAKYISDKKLIDEIILYQTNNYERHWDWFSKTLFQAIVLNNKIRLYALKKYINLSKGQYYYWALPKIGLLQSKDIAYLIALYNNENDEELKNKYKKAIDSFYLGEYWDNGDIKDFEYLYNVFKYYPRLKLEFPIFNKRKCRLHHLTLEPIEKIFRDMKCYYLQNIRRERSSKKNEDLKQKHLKYQCDIIARINENIEKYKSTHNGGYLVNIFGYLTYNGEDEQIYFEKFLDFKATQNWKKLDDNLKKEIISICLDYLDISEPLVLFKTLEEHINSGSYLIIWNVLGCLEFYDNYINYEQYIKLLEKHKFIILYFNSYKEEDRQLQQKLIKDLYINNKDFIKQQVLNFVKLDFNNHLQYTDLYEKFTLIKDDFICYLESILKIYEKELSANSIIELVNYLIKNNSEYAIKYCINILKTNIKNNKFIDNDILVSFLKSILLVLTPEYWRIIKDIFYKNKYGVEIFKRVSGTFDYFHSRDRVPLEKFRDKDLIKLYIWIKKNIQPEVNFEIVHDYKPEDNVSNAIYNFWINNGKYKCIKKIRKTMKTPEYKRSYNIALNQYIQMKTIDVSEFNKFEKRKNSLIFTLIDKSINIGSIKNSIINNIGHR